MTSPSTMTMGIPPQATFSLLGALGALLMFIADLILYFPSKPEHRTAASYFSSIDPGGTQLADSSMQYISISRVMYGGILGPVAAVLYTIGFLGLYFGLSVQEGGNYNGLLPATAAIGLSLAMTIGGAYHALFAYTCFLSQEIMASKKDGDSASSRLIHLLRRHQTYLKFLYKWAALAGIVGSLAFIYCCLTRPTPYSGFSVLFVPVLSAPLKKFLKAKQVGGIVLCGGLTNLWNLCFFGAIGLIG